MIKIKKLLVVLFLLTFTVLPAVTLAQVTAPTFGNPNYPAPSSGVTPPSFNPNYGTPSSGVTAPTFGNGTTFGSASNGGTSQCSAVTDIGDILCRIAVIINVLIPLLVLLGALYFVWGVVQYVIASDEEAKTTGKNRIVYGIIGFTVIVGVWGLVALVINTFGIAQQAPNINLTNFTVQNDGTSGGCDLGSNPKLQNLLGYATCLITTAVIPLMFVLAIAAFVWGVIQFVILGAGEEKKREEGRQFMMWGIIALTVMLCVWGLVRMVAGTFNVETFIPQVKGK